MITGIDNVVFSDKDFCEVKSEFDIKISSFWKKFITENLSQDENVELLYAKNKEMLERHDDVGFTADKSGESCFLLMSSKIERTTFDVVIEEQIKPELEFRVEAYDSKLILSKLSIYTLVTPGLIDECKFSGSVYEILCSVLE